MLASRRRDRGSQRPKGIGGFKKGQSGNPGGRPKDAEGIRELARSHAAEAVETLASIMNDKEKPPNARANAASAILDRAFGKPTQTVDATTRRVDPDSFSDDELLAYLLEARGGEPAPAKDGSKSLIENRGPRNRRPNPLTWLRTAKKRPAKSQVGSCPRLVIFQPQRTCSQAAAVAACPA